MINVLDGGKGITTEPGEILGRPVIKVHGAPVNGHPWSYHHAGAAFYVYYFTPFAPQEKSIVEIRREPTTAEDRSAMPFPEHIRACVKFALALIRTDQPTVNMALPADRWYRPEEFNAGHPDYGTADETPFTLIGGAKDGPCWFPAYA